MEKDFVLRAGIKYVLLFLLRFPCFLNDFLFTVKCFYCVSKETRDTRDIHYFSSSTSTFGYIFPIRFLILNSFCS